MKAFKLTIAVLAGILCSTFSFAQDSANQKDTISVWGNCGSCKKKIEKAAISAGASFADWNDETKILQVSYDPNKSGNQKIQKAIAATGYDTRDYTADNKAYNKLENCCKYPRKAKSNSKN